jgi:serine/threonine protein kinase
MFTSNNPKKKPKLTLNISTTLQINHDLSRDPVPTPLAKLDSCRVKYAFEKPYKPTEFIDNRGGIGIEYSNQFLLKLKQPVTPGAHAKVQQEQLVSPGRNSAIELVRKQGANSVQSEIEIYQLIASNPKSVEKAILQPLYTEKTLYENILHFPLMLGGNLKKQQNYLFNAFKDPNKKHIATFWLYRQVSNLLEAINHLHTEEFSANGNKYKGIVHGDIKPDNILINCTGDLILADFGCAYPANRPAQQFGSICYCAPEIFAYKNFTKEPIKNSEKSDIWSLGVSLISLVTNKLPNFSNELYLKKNSQLFFSNTPPNLPKKRPQESPSLFFKGGLEGNLLRKKWGEVFSKTKLAKRAQQAKQRLDNDEHCLENDLAKRKRFSDIILAMLLPVETRPSASELLTYLKSLAPPINNYLASDYNSFITDLLMQSSLNQNNETKLPSYSASP